ncbi:hypothetical protein OIU78_010716 [Salix suchowensis]|nr:hypothetical protein OIU78_010716 [Salix suchowensis]KAJ6342853.1 hypothetical protein OIU78_010716 [Salix suchowensis]
MGPCTVLMNPSFIESTSLNCFVVWKVKDAQSLEGDLVRAACQLELTPGGSNDIKAIQKQAKVRETMEAAFWDRVMESVKQDEPKYDWVVQLVGEVRDGIQELAPESWKHEIVEAIDLDLLSQVLKSGNLDIDYCGKILEFALVTLQRLSSPAQGDEMKALHQKLLKELAETCQTQDELKHPHIAAMIMGLRSVLEQIQALKQEISKVRIRMMEPLLTGPAGLDYLRKAFANHYECDLDACISLPLTMQWLSSVKNSEDQEWEEHQNSLFSLKSHDKWQWKLGQNKWQCNGFYFCSFRYR